MYARTLVSSSIFLCLLAGGARAGIHRVNAFLNSGANDGTSWADAFQGSDGLRAALAVAVAGDQVWVAHGSYEPTPGADIWQRFVLRSGIEIYGGFAGGETSLDQRDFVAHITTLTGDLLGNDGSGQFDDNSLHVVVSLSTDSSAVLDGFTVRGGNARSTGTHAHGGGILFPNNSNATVRHCILRQNRAIDGGGGCFVWGASPTFVDCRFESNHGGSIGGGCEVFVNADPCFLRCVFSGNSAGRGGGLDLSYTSDATLTNCVFRDNTSTGPAGGGAIFVGDSIPVIRQCIVAGNHSSVHAAAGILASPAINLANDIVYFNEGPGGAQGLLNNVDGGSCCWCCVQGIGPGSTGNIAADPLFVDLAAGDLHLSQCSPCADAGYNPSVPSGTTTDLDGNPRLADDPAMPDTGVGPLPIVDIGAYEVPNTLYSPFCAGDGSLATACPCGNTGAAGRGCLNSDIFSSGALLAVSGTAAPDTVVLSSDEMLPTSSCVFLQGNLQNPAGAVFGDGVRCVAGSLKRLYVKSAINGTASAPGPGEPSVSARSAALGDPITPGTQRYYQVYYRDPNLVFCPAPQGDSWNVSSGLILCW